MKELFTDITLRNGEVKKIKVELEDELAEWLHNLKRFTGVFSYSNIKANALIGKKRAEHSHLMHL